MKELLENLLKQRLVAIIEKTSNNKQNILEKQECILKKIKELLPRNCELLNDLEEVTLELEWIELLEVYKEALKDVKAIKELVS